MPTYPPPAATPQALLNFEDTLEALLTPILTADSFLSSITGLQVTTSRSIVFSGTPRVDLRVSLGPTMDYLSMTLQGKPQRQTPNAYIAQLMAKVSTTRQLDAGVNQLGQIRGRIRFLFAAPANLLSSATVYPYLQVLELLPDATSPAMIPDKDQDSSTLEFRMKFAINDWAWPIVYAQPTNETVVHPAAATFTFNYLIGTKPTTFQWQVSTNGGTSWASTADGATYQGSQTDTLVISPTAVGMNAYQYRCVLTNFYGQAVTTAAATLSVS